MVVPSTTMTIENDAAPSDAYLLFPLSGGRPDFSRSFSGEDLAVFAGLALVPPVSSSDSHEPCDWPPWVLRSVEAAATMSPPGGCTSAIGVLARAGAMKSCQIITGSVPPVTLSIGALLSLPTHTPVTMSRVRPMNQASRKFWLVPVL